MKSSFIILIYLMAFYGFTKLNTIFPLDITASEEEILISVP